MANGVKSPSTFRTLLLFMVFVPFNAEILTGSNPIELFIFNPIVAITGIVLYGFQVAILADLAARYQLSYRAIFLLGFVFTLVMEGMGSGTFENTKLVYTTLLLRVFNFNIAYAFFALAFQSVITTWMTIIAMRLAWPGRVARPFLKKWQHEVLLVVLAIAYAGLINYNLETGVFPPPSIYVLQVLIIFGLLVVVVVAIKRTLKTPVLQEPIITVRRYRMQSLIDVIFFGILAMVAGSIDTLAYAINPTKPFPVFTLAGIFGQVVAIVILLISVLLSWNMFKHMDMDPGISNAKLFAVVLVFLLFWLIVGFLFRTLPSDIVVAFILPVEIIKARRGCRANAAT
ncbi:MAG TPA: hypothetical protein VKM55_29755 [Candidatus Lokiarchaeia archaeon]|nr:hypothetical protein [Candidatus Lokiarchaeia archaeon]